MLWSGGYSSPSLNGSGTHRNEHKQEDSNYVSLEWRYLCWYILYLTSTFSNALKMESEREREGHEKGNKEHGVIRST